MLAKMQVNRAKTKRSQSSAIRRAVFGATIKDRLALCGCFSSTRDTRMWFIFHLPGFGVDFPARREELVLRLCGRLTKGRYARQAIRLS
jgi:hypothetical protein